MHSIDDSSSPGANLRSKKKPSSSETDCHSSAIEQAGMVGTTLYTSMPYADVKKRFGLAIKSWRAKSGISQEELAWRAGLHRSYVADIERGARNASLQSIEKLARALDVPFSTLFEPLGNFPAASGRARKGELVEILLVEDNPNDVAITLEAFSRKNVKIPIHVARDGAEAIEHLFGSSQRAHDPLRNRPDLILLDLNLPKLNGMEVLRRIKRNEHARSIPVIVLTDSQKSQDITESKRLGADDYLVKPVSIDRFCDIVPKLSCYWGLILQNEDANAEPAATA